LSLTLVQPFVVLCKRRVDAADVARHYHDDREIAALLLIKSRRCFGKGVEESRDAVIRRDQIHAFDELVQFGRWLDDPARLRRQGQQRHLNLVGNLVEEVPEPGAQVRQVSVGPQAIVHEHGEFHRPIDWLHLDRPGGHLVFENLECVGAQIQHGHASGIDDADEHLVLLLCRKPAHADGAAESQGRQANRDSGPHAGILLLSLAFGLMFDARIRFRRRTVDGVTSTSSSSLMNSTACSSPSRLGGMRRMASSADEARMLVCFFPW
jgi:hypothetical protein